MDAVTALILGDIIGQPGCRALFIELKNLIKDHSVDFVVANAENAAEGFGLTPELATRLKQSGVDVITTGNHIWQKRDILDIMKNDDTILRPENYPPGAAGTGLCVFNKNGIDIAVINLMGKTRMTPLDCPFRTAMSAINKARKKTKIILIDFHAEDPQEKEALGLYLDGSASAVFGTHTHVQTNDERILPKGTAYITDIGMTGPELSVIGMIPATAIERVSTQMPLRMELSNNIAYMSGIIVTVDKETGHALSIKKLYKKSVV